MTPGRRGKKERRSNERLRTAGPVHYCCSDSRSALPQGRSGLSDLGIVINFSEAGLCFIATCPLEVGQNIVLQSPRMFEGLEEGVVRWCARAGASLWRIGLKRRAFAA
jgi:hypothetical protein